MLAAVAAIEAVAERTGCLVGEGTTVFDGLITETATGVHRGLAVVIEMDGVGRTSLQTTVAGATT